KAFTEVDTATEQATLERLEKELEELEASSDRRKTLKDQLDALIKRMKLRAEEIRNLQNHTGEVRQQHNNNAQVIQRLRTVLAPHAGYDFSVHRQALHELQEGKALTLDNIDEIAMTVTRRIQGRINQQTAVITKASGEMLPAMADFLRDYPEETADKKA